MSRWLSAEGERSFKDLHMNDCVRLGQCAAKTTDDNFFAHLILPLVISGVDMGDGCMGGVG